MVLLGYIGWPPTMTVLARAGRARARAATTVASLRESARDMLGLLEINDAFVLRCVTSAHTDQASKLDAAAIANFFAHPRAEKCIQDEDELVSLRFVNERP